MFTVRKYVIRVVCIFGCGGEIAIVWTVVLKILRICNVEGGMNSHYLMRGRVEFKNVLVINGVKFILQLCRRLI